jgi:hypothetical protein
VTRGQPFVAFGDGAGIAAHMKRRNRISGQFSARLIEMSESPAYRAKKIMRMAESLWGAGMCGFFDHVFPAAGPIPSLGELQRTTPWVWLHCERCQHHAPLACAVAVIRWGADALSDRLGNAPGAARAAIRARRSSIPVGR